MMDLYKIIAILIAGLLIGLIIGTSISVNWCINTGFRLLKEQKIDIDIDEDLLKLGIKMYKNKISIG